jgi:transposase-like protein
MDSGASALAPLLDGSTAGELIPELVRHGLQQLIELEVAAVLGADRHERSEERLGYRNGYPRFQESCHPFDLTTRGLEDMINASLQRGR